MVEAEKQWHANVMSIHVVTGNTRYYIVGCYLPPDNLHSLEFVKKAWSQRRSGAIPLLIGDFNVDLDSPNNSRADIIAEQLDRWLLNKTCDHFYRKTKKGGQRGNWTWHQDRTGDDTVGRWIHKQLDYVLF